MDTIQISLKLFFSLYSDIEVSAGLSSLLFSDDDCEEANEAVGASFVRN